MPTALARKSLTRALASASCSRRPPAAPEQRADPLLEAVAGQEPVVEQAQLGAGDEHDLGSPAANPLGALGAVGEQRQHLLGGQLKRVRREPDLQAQVGGDGSRRSSSRSGSLPIQAHRGAVQVVADDLQLALDDLVVERARGWTFPRRLKPVS